MKLKRMRKWYLALLILVGIICVGCSEYDSKIPIPIVEEDVYVYDQDNIIDNETEEYLNELLVKLERATTAEVAVVSTKSLLDKSIEDYSYQLANTLKIGKADKDNGVLLLISRSDKKVRLEIGKGLEGCLNDSKCGRILDDYFVPYRDDDRYSEATRDTIEAVVSIIAKEYNVEIDMIQRNYNQELEESEKASKEGDWILTITLILLIAIAVILDLSDGSSGSSGSSFSSGGSSGGSGFGGGSFGGGGASR